MTQEQKRWFRIGYKAAIEDSIDRCRRGRIDVVDLGDKKYNTAITHCISAVKALDVSHAIILHEAAIEKARADG